MSESALPLHYIDRETGREEQEIIYGEAELRFLYHTLWGRGCRNLVTHPLFSRLNALPKRYWTKKADIENFIQKYDVNAHEAALTPAEYPTLDAYFCRKLKPGVRPIDNNPRVLVSPADGRVLAYRITPNLRLRVKQQDVSIASLVDSARAAQTLIGGSALVVRLAPKDYHRFHFPVEGIAMAPKKIGGKLESVHPIALNSSAESFYNKRVVTQIETEAFGPVYMVDVGALTVGTIVQTYAEGKIKKGQEKGYFRFGGSTVVVLWGEKGPVLDEDLIANTAKDRETLVKYGTQIASMPV